MMMTKKTIPLNKVLIAVLFILLLNVVGMTCVWAQSFTSGNLKYSIYSAIDHTVIVTGHVDGTSAIGDVVIPETIEYAGVAYAVTAIWDNAFYDCSSLVSVTIPNSVKWILERAFYGCSSLVSITIPNSVEWIQGTAFYGCSNLTSVYFTDDVVQWCGHSFGDIFPNGYNLFIDNELLTDLTIPETVSFITDYAFAKCSSLASVTIPNSVTAIGVGTFSSCLSLTSVTIGNSVTEIGQIAFACCSSLTSVIIPNSVTTIDHRTFYGCSGLVSVVFPNSVTEIGEEAFYGCSSLTSVTFGNGLTSIGNYAFRDCTGLTSVHISDLAAWCNISFGSFGSMFMNPLYYAHHLYLNDNEITDLVIPNSVTSIGNGTFPYCTGLTSVNIPNSVTSIGGEAFYGCTGLTSVNIPNSVTEISWSTFSGCSGLERITVDPENPFFDSREECNAIIDSGSNCLFMGCKNTVIPNSVTSIGDAAFYDCSSLVFITIPNSVEWIGVEAFYGCSSLVSVTIPNSVKLIFDRAFWDCSGLTSVTIPNSVTLIEDGAFAGCSSLISVDIPNSVTEITSSTFSGCSSLVSVTIPNSVTYIGDQAFNDCSSLASVAIPNSVTYLGWRAFYGCSSLASVTIPNSVTRIKEEAFAGCIGLESITSYMENPIGNYGIFSGVNRNTPINVLCGKTMSYLAEEGWNDFTNYHEFSTEYDLIVEPEDSANCQTSIEQLPSCTTGETTVKATPSPGYSFVAWYENGIAMSTNPVYTFCLNNNKRLIAKVQYGTGIDELSVNDLMVYPNPSQGQVTVEGNGFLKVANLLGQTIFTKEIEGQTTLELPKGVYIFTLNRTMRKVVVK